MNTATMPAEILAALQALAAATNDRVSIEIEYVCLDDGALGALYAVVVGRAGYRHLRHYWGDTLDETIAAAMDAQARMEQQP